MSDKTQYELLKEVFQKGSVRIIECKPEEPPVDRTQQPSKEQVKTQSSSNDNNAPLYPE